MPEPPQSPLPKDPEYWDELARRIGEDAAGPLAGYAHAQAAWYGVLAQRAPWFVAASAAATLVFWLALPAVDSVIAFRWIERSLAPDEMAGVLVGGPAPPSVDALLLQFPSVPTLPSQDGGDDLAHEDPH